MNIIWSPLAVDRVAEIAAYIYQEDPSAAEEWIRRIFARVQQLSSFPRSGRRVPETTRKDIREILWGNYRIIYRIGRKEVYVLTVRHARQILPIDELRARGG